MRPTEILMEEHRIIEQVLACLEKMARLGETEGRIDADAARSAVSFFRTFADRCHHAKEETELFPVMEAKGHSPEMGPTAVMRHEHEEGRRLVGLIEKSIEGAAAGRVDRVKAFVVHARSYVEHLREHIQKEDLCLFPMADQILGPEDQQDLLRRFGHVEQEQIGQSVHDRFHRLADELADRFGVPRARLQPHS